MNHLLKKTVLLLLFLLLFLPQHVARADTGPKPTMDFQFKQAMAGEPVTIVSGILYECQQADCSDASALEQLGPQGFNCTEDQCDALAYGFAPYHRLEIEFSDGKTRQSNVFETAGFNSIYTVTIQPEDLLVETQISSFVPNWTTAAILLCICFLCAGVLLIGAIVLVIRLASKK